MDRPKRIVFGVIGIGILILLYSWLSYRQHQINPNDTTIPNLSQLIEGAEKIVTPQGSIRKEVWLSKDAYATYTRLFFGLTWGCVFSVFIGILMGCFSTVESLLVPPLSFLAKVPATAMLAVFFVIVGTGESMFVAMIGFGVLPVLAQGIYLSAKHDVHDEHVDKAYTLGASNYEVITGVVLPQVLPKILESIRLQIGPAMVYLIAAEYMMADVGFGYRLRIQSRLLHMNVVYDYLIILGATGFLMDCAMVCLRKWLCPWYDRGE
jgi:NitT/TauT family transport system permease protein